MRSRGVGASEAASPDEEENVKHLPGDTLLATVSVLEAQPREKDPDVVVGATIVVGGGGRIKRRLSKREDGGVVIVSVAEGGIALDGGYLFPLVQRLLLFVEVVELLAVFQNDTAKHIVDAAGERAVLVSTVLVVVRDIAYEWVMRLLALVGSDFVDQVVVFTVRFGHDVSVKVRRGGMAFAP